MQQVSFDASLVLIYRRGLHPKIHFNNWRTYLANVDPVSEDRIADV